MTPPGLKFKLGQVVKFASTISSPNPPAAFIVIGRGVFEFTYGYECNYVLSGPTTEGGNSRFIRAEDELTAYE